MIALTFTVTLSRVITSLAVEIECKRELEMSVKGILRKPLLHGECWVFNKPTSHALRYGSVYGILREATTAQHWFSLAFLRVL